jgi:thiol:disulfide interchange protein DsbD
MFTFALGMGQLFLILGTFAVSMPKSGPWMEYVKEGLALIIFGAGLYYLETIVPEPYYAFLVAAALLAAGVYFGWIKAREAGSPREAALRRGSSALFAAAAVAFVVMVPKGQLPGIRWDSRYESAMARAKEQSVPVVIDFTADWCAACKELEHKTYTDPRVVSAAQEFVTIKIDATKSTPEFEALRDRYAVKGLPTILFLSPEGTSNDDLTITGFVPPEEFLRRLCRVEGAHASRLNDVCQG